MYPGPMYGPGYPFQSSPQNKYLSGFTRLRGYRSGVKRNRLACQLCDSTDHLIKYCERMKASKRKKGW